MDINTFYRVPEEEAYRHVKKVAQKGSIKLAICQLFFELYISKKTILNCLPLLSTFGKILVQCNFSNISDIVKWLEDNNFNYYICHISEGYVKNNFACSHKGSLFVVIHKDDILINAHPTNIIAVDQPGDYSVLIDSLSDIRDDILCVGNGSVESAIYCKKMCRNIICLASAGPIDTLLREAVRERNV